MSFQLEATFPVRQALYLRLAHLSKLVSGCRMRCYFEKHAVSHIERGANVVSCVAAKPFEAGFSPFSLPLFREMMQHVGNCWDTRLFSCRYAYSDLNP